MLSSLAGKAALSKVGLSADAFDLTKLTSPSGPPREPNKLRKNPPPGYDPNNPDDDDSWGAWFSSINVKSLPLTVHPWLAPAPPAVAVAALPNVGDKAPADKDRKLQLGGRKTLVVFLRCVGCAFAQKTFLTLRTIANRHPNIRCVAVSHSAGYATKKWIDLMGGAWNVEVVIDEGRALYAAWGLGLGNFMYLFHPTTQAQGWKEKGWLGDEVAAAVQRTGPSTVSVREKKSTFDEDDDEDDNSGVMGNKWQQAGAFAIDSKGTVIWGGKAERADDMMNLEEGARILVL